MPTCLYVVIPCYNEEEALPITAEKIAEKMNRLQAQGIINDQSRVLLVNDGSKDKTWEIIKSLYESNSLFAGLDLTRNRGHQNALLAGLMTAKDHCDVSISMDADLQDDINAIDDMLAKYSAGADIVYGVRKQRTTDTFFKRFTARFYYKILKLMGANIVYDHADYRLMSRRALEGLAEFREVNLFLRGIVPMIGYPTAITYYDRSERVAGESKYPLRKMLSFAIEGITSLSTQPIKWITRLGFFVFLVSIGMLVYSVVQYFSGNTTAGWASLIVSIWAVGGLILLAIGVIGEYIGKIYLESKARPRFLIKEFLLRDEPDSGLDTPEENSRNL